MINLILFCFGTAALTVFLDMTFQKGMIFRKYYNLITYWFYLPSKKYKLIISEDYVIYFSRLPKSLVLSLKESLEERHNIFKRSPCFQKNKFIWLYKVLGGCSFCFGTWIYLIGYIVSIADFSYLIVLGIGINHVFIKLIEKI